MTRDELVEAGSEAIKPVLLAHAQVLTRPSPVHLAQVTIDAVEPMIIAAEQEDADRRVDRMILRNAERWARLRTEVQRLHEEPYPHIFYGGEPTGWQVALNKVLILMDGDNDGQE